jgi:hypothetical protein
VKEYECRLSRRVLRPTEQTATLTVRAETEVEAEAQVMKLLENVEELGWQDLRDEPAEVVDCEVVEVIEAVPPTFRYERLPPELLGPAHDCM